MMSLLCATLTSEKYLEHPNKVYLAFSQMAFVGRPEFRRRSVTTIGPEYVKTLRKIKVCAFTLNLKFIGTSADVDFA